MKFRQKSDGKKFLVTAMGLWMSLVSCTVVHQREQTEAQLETSLAADRAEIEDLRKNIPEPKKSENDALKQILTLTGEVKDPPHRVREKFNRLTQRMRQDFQKQSRRERETFNRTEKQAREKFYDALKSERDEFSKTKVDKESRKKFYDDQDRRRKEFTADQKDRRAQFNSDMKQKQDDFNTVMRDKNNEFRQEMRSYTDRFNEQKKQKEAERLQKKKDLVNTNGSTNFEPLKSGD